MDFGLSQDEQAFRQEVAEFLDRELTPEVLREVEERGLPGPLYFRFQRKLGARGWLGLTWPREYGGQDRSPMDRFIFIEQLALRGVEFRNLAESIVGPTLILYGTEEQKKEFLPRIASGELVFCLLYSEPHAGSDLASLEIRAQDRGDHYVLNGQKLFSSEADLADYGWIAARTDPGAPKHRGISVLITQMSAPGITVRPLISMAGDRRFNEVYFDNTRVSKDLLVGEENRGWYYLAVALDFERATAGAAAFVGTIQRTLRELADCAGGTRYGVRSLARSRLIRDELAQRAVELEVMRTLSYRVLWLLGQGQVPNYQAAAIKLFGSELAQRVVQTASTILGLYGQLGPGSPQTPLEGTIARFGLRSVSDTIRGGTSEIQRNIIAQRGLGMPTE